MAHDGGGPAGQMKLDQYSEKIPLGWQPGLSWYPAKRYLDLLELWHRLTDLAPEKVGIAAAGRLQGRMNTLALELTITKQDGTVLRGINALAHPGERAATGQPASPSGLQAIANIIRSKYGATDQDQQGVDLDDFLDLRRNRHSLLEYLIEYEHRYDRARTSSGLRINEVGLSHMLLKYCQMDGRTKANIMLLVNHDLRQYRAIFDHLQRIAKTDSVPGVSSNITYAGDTGPNDGNEEYDE